MDNNTKTVSFYDPKSEAEAKRKRQLAEVLIAKSNTPLQNEMAGGMTVARSPWENVNQVAQGLMGKYQLKKADEMEAEQGLNRQKMLSEALSKFGENPQESAMTLAQDPRYADMAAKILQGEVDYGRKQERYAVDDAFRQKQLDMMGQRASQSNMDPSSVREYQYFSSLPDEEKQAYLTMKRSQQWRDLGDSQVMPNPLNPNQPMATFGKGIEPERKLMPDGRIVTMPAVTGSPRGALPESMTNMQGVPRQQPNMMASQQPNMGGVDIQQLPKSQAEIEKEKGRQEQKARAGGTVIQDINRAINAIQENPKLTTGFGSFLRGIPMTDAKEVSGYIESALSNVGLDTLQTMRENSPTGGALGQVPIQQQKRLEQVLGSLDMSQSPQTVQDNLRRVSNIYMDIVYGTPEEIAEIANRGEIDMDRARELMQRHPLSFDEFGNPLNQQQPQQQQQQQPEFAHNPQTGEILINRGNGWEPYNGQ